MQQADTRVWEVLQGVRTPDGVKITKENQIVWIGEAVPAILLLIAAVVMAFANIIKRQGPAPRGVFVS
jgi:hypothetical protein